jgi:hypothetical protein
MTTAPVPSPDRPYCSQCGGELPYGHEEWCPYVKVPDGLGTMATIAAPMLAGFTIALAGVVAQAADKFRWPGVALLLLTISAVLLVTSVQAGFWSQRPVALWRITFWRIAAARTYAAGIVVLFLGLSAVLVPPDISNAWRWAAASIALLAAVGETIWGVVAHRLHDGVPHGRH